MASWKEIDRVTKSPAEARGTATALLRSRAADMTEWEGTFLESIARHTDGEPLTTRQAEKLLQIRDDLVLVTKTYIGLSVGILIEKVYLGRIDLCEDDEDWIVRTRKRSGTSIARKDLGHLMRLAKQLNLIEPEAA